MEAVCVFGGVQPVCVRCRREVCVGVGVGVGGRACQGARTVSQ